VDVDLRDDDDVVEVATGVGSEGAFAVPSCQFTLSWLSMAVPSLFEYCESAVNLNRNFRHATAGTHLDETFCMTISYRVLNPVTKKN